MKTSTKHFGEANEKNSETNEKNISIRISSLCEQLNYFLMFVVLVWVSGILCDKTVYVFD